MQALPFRRSIVHLSIAGALFAAPGTLLASSFALVESTASGLGNSYAGVAAVADDAGTVYWNPAGMTRLNALSVSLNMHSITPSAKFHNDNSQAACVSATACRSLGGDGGDAGSTAWVPAMYAVLPVTPRLAVGLGVSGPFGLKTEYPSDWAGRYQAVKSDLKTINVNPGVAFKVNDMVSLGAGVNYQKLDAELTNVVNMTAVMARAAASGAIPASVAPAVIGASLAVPDAQATVKGDDSSYGYNLGVLVNLAPTTRVGLSYRSAIKYKVQGDVTFDLPTVAATSTATGVIGQVLGALRQPGQALASGPVRADIKLPDSFSLSLAHDLNPQLQLLADVSWTGWSNIPKLEFARSDGTVLNSVEYDWKDTWRYSVGANYRMSDRFTLRAGVAFDQSPMDDAHRTPRLPDSDRTWVSIGGRWSFTPSTALEFGYAYLFMKDPVIRNRNDGSTAGYGSLDGTYSSNVSIASIGLTHTFR